MNKNVRRMVNIALLIALQIVLSRFLSINTPFIRIGFSFIPLAAIGMLYGPLWGAAGAVIADLIPVLSSQDLPSPLFSRV